MIQDLTLTSLVFYLGHHARCLHLRAAQRLANIEDWSPGDALPCHHLVAELGKPLTKTGHPISQGEAFFLREGLCQPNTWKLTAMR